MDAATGAVLASVYRRTEGNPVEAAQALVAEVAEMAPRPVVAVGLTGSGRDAAATVFRAAFPDLGERLTVQNEIVAHATAAAALDPEGGRSLSIVEIGGQDAKFINVENGRVVDADMNRVCSAGTGSFLEEQAIAHGVDDIAEFGRLAALSDGPPDLGQTCTVFVADVAAEALGDGFSREDIFAGLQHSVVRNYRSRVMGQRRLLGRVFFQGKPATDPALARTLAAVLEREVVVPPDPGAMGAVGIALLTARSVDAARATPVDLTRMLSARVAGRREFQCGDRDCLNSCHLELAEIAVGGAVEKVVSGGQCPKYDAVSAAGEKLPKDAPNPYREREALLSSLLDEEAGDGTGDGGEAGAPRRVPRPAHRPAVRALSDRHAAVLPHAAPQTGAPRRGAPSGPRHAGGGRPALRRPRSLRPGQAAARAGRRGRRRALRPDLRAPAAAQRRRPDLHVPHGAGRAGHGGARAARRGLVHTRASPGALRQGGRRVRRRPDAALGLPGGARARRERGRGSPVCLPRSTRRTPPPSTCSAASRPGCTPSAGGRCAGRAATATRWC